MNDINERIFSKRTYTNSQHIDVAKVSKIRLSARRAKWAQIDRSKLWRYCQAAYGQSAHRARRLNVPHDIDAFYIDELLVDQDYSCAVSGIVLECSSERFGGPFGPSLDRIVPELGYVRGNLRVVCQIVNVAMNAWGLEALQTLVTAMGNKR